MKHILLIIICLILATSCKNLVDDDAETEFDLGYYPLKVGNVWVYREEYQGFIQDTIVPNYLIKEVVGTQDFEGKTYFKVDSYFKNKEKMTQSTYLRVENDIVYQYNPEFENHKKSIFADLNYPSQIENAYNNRIVYKEKGSLNTEIGLFDKCVWTTIPAVDGASDDVYAPNIGMIYSDNFGVIYKIVYTKISSEELGDDIR